MAFIDQIIEWDKALFIALNSWGIESLDPIFLAISEIFIWIPLYAFFVFLLFKKLELKTALIFVAAAIACVVLTDQISVHGFKNIFERFRPCHTADLEGKYRLVKDGCGGWFGFVSSHAANTFGFAVLMGFVFKQNYPYILWVLIFWASLISYSRIYLGVHFPLDIICGGLLGSAIGFFCYAIANRFISKT